MPTTALSAFTNNQRPHGKSAFRKWRYQDGIKCEATQIDQAPARESFSHAGSTEKAKGMIKGGTVSIVTRAALGERGRMGNGNGRKG
jgi:hypothetical protein